MSAPEWIAPQWPAPTNVHAAVSTRLGGVSEPPFDTLNLGDHVGDNPKAVAENRRRLCEALGVSGSQVGWIRQVHGTRVLSLPDGRGEEGDASTTTRSGPVCAILTADCLPVLFCNRAGTRVAAAHAGWRGLLAGVLEETVAVFDQGDDIVAWMGPAIGPDRFEVGPEVRDAFLREVPDLNGQFAPHPDAPGKLLADLYGLARKRLATAGVTAVYGGGLCTVSDPARFFSYRRDQRTGRMASLIWMT